MLKIGIQTLNYIYFNLISILHSLENTRSLVHECILISLVYKWWSQQGKPKIKQTQKQKQKTKNKNKYKQINNKENINTK